MSLARLLRALPRLPYDPRRHGLYRLNEELVVSRHQSVYDPGVFGRYDLATQRVVPREAADAGIWAVDLDSLMGEAGRLTAQHGSLATADRYDVALALVTPGRGTVLDACTAAPEERVRAAVTALGYDYLPIDIDGDGTTVQREDLTRLSFPDGSIARVLSLDTLEHIRDYEQALAEIQRVLEPAGVAILHTPCYYVDRPDNVDIEGESDPWGHVRYFSARAFLEAVARAGLVPLRVGFQLDYGAVLCVAAKRSS